jgi:TspO/MBR family
VSPASGNAVGPLTRGAQSVLVGLGLHSPFFAWLVILALLAAIMVTIGLFLGRDKVSAYAVVLYARWVGYATFLNAGIWWLSKRPGAASAQKDGLYSNHRRLTRSVGHIWAAAACSWSAPTLLSPKAAAASMCALYPANLAQES